MGTYSVSTVCTRSLSAVVPDWPRRKRSLRSCKKSDQISSATFVKTGNGTGKFHSIHLAPLPSTFLTSTDVPGCNSFSEDEPTSTERPLLHEHNGHNFLNYSRRPLIGLPDYPRRTGLKPLTDAQIEALDTLESLANQLALSFEFKTGDIQYVNNLALLHGREAFQCQQPMGCRRHLLRMFLKNEGDDLSLPRELDAVIQGLYDHDVEEECFPWSLEPLPYILSP